MDALTELIKDELEFCIENEFSKNEFDQFIYTSTNGHSSMNLPYILNDYKQWLIDNKKI